MAFLVHHATRIAYGCTYRKPQAIGLGLPDGGCLRSWFHAVFCLRLEVQVIIHHQFELPQIRHSSRLHLRRNITILLAGTGTIITGCFQTGLSA